MKAAQSPGRGAECYAFEHYRRCGYSVNVRAAEVGAAPGRNLLYFLYAATRYWAQGASDWRFQVV